VTLIAQISDIHAKPGAASFKALGEALRVLATVRPDAVVVSGDLSNKPHAEGYAALKHAFAALSCPFLAVPGNADRREEMRTAFPDAGWPADGPLHLHRTIAGVRLVGLDVTVPGEKHGEVTPEVLSFLSDALEQVPRLPTLVFMHQHPFQTFGAGLDRLMCRNVEPLRLLLDGTRTPVLALLCGHAHRALTTRFGRTMAIMCPSLEAANAALVDGHEAPPVTDPPGLMLHVVESERLVSHTISLG
jgi:3',5'-cyclic AMP phosphodiesterase CpdA